ncbi:MAG: bifunctional UDP-3-O-[3-hydroxymyristoyl] N-acetylglucosamine deacetylase/3-hydroxyacyl-ACP dehydratase [Gemmatimonadota bacterium]|nr:MAG: bifunctional UDP-3-O-[3-hydroxymyristoyl] N-acetylglucosamine deacetylase/3-hydroxyacyl-ACP dehydratase [Gemmatimonadota bacterium]
MLKQQQTIKEPVSYKGIGLHTGKPVTMTFRPSDINTGVRFVRLDLPDRPNIQADIDHVIDVSRGTTLGDGDVRVSTVEHVLSALAGLQIDNILVELDSEEAPVGDGSALPIVEVLLKNGLQEQDSPKDYLIIEDTISFTDKERGVDIVVLPSDDYRITFMIDYKNPALGTQYTSMYSLEEEFVKEYAAARTFSFLSEVEALREEGLIQGGSLENAIVIVDKEVDEKELTYFKDLFGIKKRVFVGTNGTINNVTLRFENEFVRHKTLDLIGDLFLLGVPLQGHVLAARSGHAANVELVKKIRQVYEKKQITSKYQEKGERGFFLDIRAIQKIMPHRYPFLLVDRIIDLEPRKRVIGLKNVTINEPFFNGHFPEHPIMPGVLIVEAMAQVGGVLLLNTVENPETKLVYFMGLDGVRFRKPVHPGDQIRFELEMVKFRRNTCKMEGKAFVSGDLVAEATLMASVVDK